MKQIRIMMVEDDQDFQYLIRKSLAQDSDFLLVGSCVSGESAYAMAVKEKPDIVLMDLALRTDPMEGVLAARKIRLGTEAKVILLTSYEDPATVVEASVRAFASAYVLKSQFSLLLPTIRETAQGVMPQSHLICTALLQRLTPAEMVVFQYMMGMSVTIRSSEKTIANQQTSVLRKLGLQNKKQMRHVFSAYFPGMGSTGK